MTAHDHDDDQGLDRPHGREHRGHEHGGHDHGGHGHGGHGHGLGAGRALGIAVVLNIGLAVAQVVAGVVFGSVAVLADAAHQVVDAIGLVVGWIALRLARRPSSPRRTWGWGRADALGAQLSALILMASLVFVVVESVRRLSDPHEVVGLGVFVTGVAGVLVNGGSLRAVVRGGTSLSLRAARLHLLADLAGSVLLIVVGLVVRLTGWDRLDPIASLALSLLLVRSTWSLLRHSADVLLDSAPAHVDVEEVASTIVAERLEVRAVHHVHVWTTGPTTVALSAHVEVDGATSIHEAQTSVSAIENCCGAIRHRPQHPPGRVPSVRHAGSRS
ncbi:MAG: cation diffusion facilitator family transporter [Ilumatobacteraceae bacterium]